MAHLVQPMPSQLASVRSTHLYRSPSPCSARSGLRHQHPVHTQFCTEFQYIENKTEHDGRIQCLKHAGIRYPSPAG